MPRKPCVSLRHGLRSQSVRQVELFQKPGKSVVSVKRLKKWLDRQQIYEVCFVVDRFIQAPECQIRISHPDRGKTFCQWGNVLPACKLMKFFDTFARSLKAAHLGMGRGQQADIQWEIRTRQALYDLVVALLPEVQESFIQSRFRVVAIQLERLPEKLCSRGIISLYVVQISHAGAVAG